MILAIDYENNAERWWDAVREAADVPADLHPLIHGTTDRVEVPADRIGALRQWCASLPGWADGPAHARHALVEVLS